MFIFFVVLLYLIFSILLMSGFLFPQQLKTLIKRMDVKLHSIGNTQTYLCWIRCKFPIKGRLNLDWIKKHILATLFILIAPPIVAISLKSQITLNPFLSEPPPINPIISALLEGEQLIPPPASPPEIFLTQEIQAEYPLIESANRDWSLLNNEFRKRLLFAFKIMHDEHGYEMVLLEGYRTPERQSALANIGSNVTNAGPNQSYHQFGLAADCAFMKSGKVIISEKDPWAMQGYQLFGEVAESVGLTWGGRWKMMDLGHVEYRKLKNKLIH